MHVAKWQCDVQVLQFILILLANRKIYKTLLHILVDQETSLQIASLKLTENFWGLIFQSSNKGVGLGDF